MVRLLLADLFVDKFYLVDLPSFSRSPKNLYTEPTFACNENSLFTYPHHGRF